MAGSEFLAAAEALAAQEELFVVTSEMKKGATPVSLEVDDRSGEVAGLHVAGDYYAASEIAAGKGAKIRIDGVDNSRDVLRIKATSASATKVELVLTYLHNGRKDDGDPDKYRAFPLELRRENGAWRAFLPGGDKVITSLYLSKNTFLGILVGIDSIRPKLSENPVNMAVALAY